MNSNEASLMEPIRDLARAYQARDRGADPVDEKLVMRLSDLFREAYRVENGEYPPAPPTRPPLFDPTLIYTISPPETPAGIPGAIKYPPKS